MKGDPETNGNLHIRKESEKKPRWRPPRRVLVRGLHAHKSIGGYARDDIHPLDSS